MIMKKFSTIPVSVEVKKILEKAKGERTWDEFLISLLKTANLARRLHAAEELEKRFDDDLERAIKESIEESRRRLRFREPDS